MRLFKRKKDEPKQETQHKRGCTCVVCLKRKAGETPEEFQKRIMEVMFGRITDENCV